MNPARVVPKHMHWAFRFPGNPTALLNRGHTQERSGLSCQLLPGPESLSRAASDAIHDGRTTEAACISNHRWADEERTVDAQWNLLIHEEGGNDIPGK